MPAALQKVDHLSEVGFVVRAGARVGEIALRERGAKKMVQIWQIDIQLQNALGGALGFGKKRGLVEGRLVKITKVQRADAYGLRHRCGLIEAERA